MKVAQEMEEDVERRINEELERLRTLDEGQRKVPRRPPSRPERRIEAPPLWLRAWMRGSVPSMKASARCPSCRTSIIYCFLTYRLAGLLQISGGCISPHGGLRTFHQTSTCPEAINFMVFSATNLLMDMGH